MTTTVSYMRRTGLGNGDVVGVDVAEEIHAREAEGSNVVAMLELGNHVLVTYDWVAS